MVSFAIHRLTLLVILGLGTSSYFCVFLILVTALLRYNSHTIQVSGLRYKIQWFFGIVRELCNQHHNLWEQLITHVRSPVHASSPSPLLLMPSVPLPQPWATTPLFSVSIDLLILGFSYALNHILCGLCDRLVFCFYHLLPCLPLLSPFIFSPLPSLFSFSRG